MNRLIFEQLKKVMSTDLPDYNKDTTHMIIPKKGALPTSLAIGRAYLIKVEPYITNPPNGFNLHANWNKGIVPKHQFMYALMTQDMGKMIRIDAYGYDETTNCIVSDRWQGWLPKKSITIVKEVEWKA